MSDVRKNEKKKVSYDNTDNAVNNIKPDTKLSNGMTLGLNNMRSNFFIWLSGFDVNKPGLG